VPSVLIKALSLFNHFVACCLALLITTLPAALVYAGICAPSLSSLHRPPLPFKSLVRQQVLDATDSRLRAEESK